LGRHRGLATQTHRISTNALQIPIKNKPVCSKTTQKHSFHFDKEHKVTQGLQHLKMEKRMNQQIAQGQIPVCDLVDMHPQITPGYLLRIAYIALQHLKSKTLLQMEGRKSRLEKKWKIWCGSIRVSMWKAAPARQ
jgi:hypothetical protein